MKTFCLAAVMPVVFALLSGPAFAEAGHHHHDGSTAARARLVLNQGQKWQTDAPLRQGMEAMHSALAGNLHAIHQGKLPAAEYKRLGETVEQAIAGIVAECKLSPGADAVLHVLIGEMVTGAAAMTGKTDAPPRAGAHKVVMALNNYGRYFDHPGWADLK